MRPLLKVFTIVFFVIGFFVPWVWVLAVVSAVSAIVNASDNLGAHARGRNSGLPGHLRDDNVVSQKSKPCPACLGTVSIYAAKCQFCGEVLEVSSN